MSAGLPDPETTVELLPAQVSDLLPAILRGEIELIDCREDEEWRFNRIEGARLVPLTRVAEAAVPEKPAIIYCHHGMRSLHATAFLRAHGLENSFSMAGGIDEWSRTTDPGVPRY